MMITSEILKFLENVKPWQEALNNRKEINDRPAIYALISNITLPRLIGETRILYIGQTKCLGGSSDRARLYGYRYPSGNHGRLIRSRTERLMQIGHEITLHWLHVESEESARHHEATFLAQHMEEHLEFPPFNGKA
jgi:hypothetical protein